MFNDEIEKISYATLSRADWLQLRNETGGRRPDDDYVRFGGSDIGVILGANDYKAKGALFYELLGLKSPHLSINPHMYRGIQTEQAIYEGWWRYFDPEHPDIETLIANWSSDNIIRTADDAKYMLLNPKYPHMFSNIDYAVPEQNGLEKRILEIKNMMWSTVDKWEGDLDPNYVLQLQSYMMVSEFEEGELFILKDTTYPLCFQLMTNKDIQLEINDAVNEFAAYVLEARALIAKETDQEKIMAIVHEYEPEPEQTPAYIQFLKDIHKPGATEEPEMDEDLYDAVYNYSKIKSLIKEQEADAIKKEAIIRNYFKVNNAIKFTHEESKQAISWKTKLYIPPKFHIKADERADT